MVRLYRCPVCMNTANIMDGKDNQKFDYIYTKSALSIHLEIHSFRDLFIYILDDADDPDNNYWEDKELLNEFGK